MTASVLDFIPQSYHAAILAGTSEVDVAPYLNSGLNAKRILELPPFGQMSIGSSVFIPSGGGLVGANFGCTIKALPSLGNQPLIRNSNAHPDDFNSRDRNIVIERIRLDGNHGNNHSATVFSHGVQLFAVDGAKLDVWVLNVKGDGVGLDASFASNIIGCSDVTGKIRTQSCQRNGVSITCAEQVDVDVYDTGSKAMSVHLRPHVRDNFIRNVFVRLLSIGTGDGSDLSGGACVAGEGTGSTPTNVTVDFQIFNSGGQGVIWRDVKGLILRGTIENPHRNGLVGDVAGVAPSSVFFNSVRVFSPGGSGIVAREVQGAVYDGFVVIDEAEAIGAHIANARGGKLDLTVRNSRQQGIYLSNTQNMIFPSPVSVGNNGHNVWLLNNSSGNRFQFLKSVGSNWGWGFLEEAGCDDNRAFYSRVSGNAAGNVSTRGSRSSVHLEG